MRTTFGLLALLALCTSGCATTHAVRYVYQDGDFGVVGLPENTDRWPTHYRRQADKLMSAHFPEGHEIVRAEEVDEGSRTLKLEGRNAAEVAPSWPGTTLSALKLGRTASRSRAETTKIKECRMIYRRAGSQEHLPTFSEVASLEPAPYLNPNTLAKHQVAKPVAATPTHKDATEESPEKDDAFVGPGS